MRRAVLKAAAPSWSHGPSLLRLLPVAAAGVGVAAAAAAVKPQQPNRSKN